MKGFNYGENVRPMRALKKGRKMRREREKQPGKIIQLVMIKTTNQALRLNNSSSSDKDIEASNQPDLVESVSVCVVVPTAMDRVEVLNLQSLIIVQVPNYLLHTLNPI